MTESFDFSILWKLWRLSYYTLPLMSLICLAVIFYAITVNPKTTMVKIILCFALASFTQFIIDSIIVAYKNGSSIEYVQPLAISGFIIVEVTCCYWLVALSKVSLLQTRLIQSLLILFYVFEIIYITLVFFNNRFNAFESFIELPLVVTFTCIYYYNLLIKPPQQQLIKQPLFWAVSGLALIAIVQIPCNIVLGYIAKYTMGQGRLFMAITSLSYSFLFICFLKAMYELKKSNNATKKL